MITSAKACRLAVTLVAGVVGFLPASPIRAQSLLEQCWAPESLAASDAERRPVRVTTRQALSLPPQAVPPGVAPGGRDPGAVRRVELPKGQKLVALTLDLCEQAGEVAGYDGPVFDVLRRHGAKATVFAGGKWMVTHSERTQQLMADPLLEIGSHGWAHRNVRGLEGRALQQEIRLPLDAYVAQRTRLGERQCVAAAPARMAAVPARMGLYRFPYGACNPAALDAIAAEGMRAIQWDLSTGDATPTTSAETIASHLIRNTRPGSIILAHANGRGYQTAAALAIALPRMIKDGWKFVTVSELMAAGKPVLVPTCYDMRPGDTDRYDALFLGARPQPATKSERPL